MNYFPKSTQEHC